VAKPEFFRDLRKTSRRLEPEPEKRAAPSPPARGKRKHRPAVEAVVVPEGVLVDVPLEVLGADGLVDAPRPRLNRLQTPSMVLVRTPPST
jgi:hypothetical protein